MSERLQIAASILGATMFRGQYGDNLHGRTKAVELALDLAEELISAEAERRGKPVTMPIPGPGIGGTIALTPKAAAAKAKAEKPEPIPAPKLPDPA